MKKETERKILRQVVRDVEVEKGIDPGPDPDRPEFCEMSDAEANELASFLIESGQATMEELNNLNWFPGMGSG